MELETPKVSERAVVWLVTAVQFVNILDFVMVMPLGPDFARALGIPASEIGLIGGSYTAAAAVAGLAGSLFLDRFDRRKALAVAMVGLVTGTALGGLAWNLPSLLAARILAGCFGGPATSLSLSIIADVVPPARRGKALGVVMGAFSVASVLGVPMALKAAEWVSWRTPFFGVAAIGLLVSLAAVFLLPSLTGHLKAVRTRPDFGALFAKREVLLSYTMTSVSMMAGFVLIPNLSAYVQVNLGYPRSELSWLYLWGGVVSLISLQLVGRLVDRFGSFRVGTFGSLSLGVVIYWGFIAFPPSIPVLGIFIGFMFSMAFRNVAYNTLTSRVPGPGERAQFMSIQSAVQHLSTSAAAIFSSRMLSEAPDGKLVGMEPVAGVSLFLSLLLPAMLFAVERQLRIRQSAALG